MVMLECADLPWLSGRVPNGYWDLRENRIRYMDWLADQCGFRTPEDWYQARKSDFKRNRGGGLLCTQYEDSVYAALRDYRPDFAWLPWRFHTAPKKFWALKKNRHRYMNWLETELGFRQPADWYDVTKETFRRHDGAGLLKCLYGDSVIAAVQDFRPDYRWLAWRFRETPNRFWQQPANRHAYMSWLGTKLGYRVPEDWYGITKQSFHDHYGAGLLRCHYDDSPQRAVREFLPETDWKPWLFTSVPQNFWQDVDNRLWYLRWLGEQLSFRNSTDWFRLSSGDLKRHGGAGLLAYYANGAMGQALAEILRRSGANPQTSIWAVIQLIECSLTDRDPQSLFLSLA